METVHTPLQEKSNFESEVDELAITMAKLANYRAELLKGETRTNVQIQPIPLESLEKKKTPRVTSCTQLEIELQQPPMEKGMSIQELVFNHKNEGKNMVEISFEGQHESLPSLFEVIKEEILNYNEDATSRSKDELEKIQNVEDDAKNSRIIVVKEDELNSSESHEKTKDEIVKTIPEMAPWVRCMRSLKLRELAPCPSWKSALFI